MEILARSGTPDISAIRTCAGASSRQAKAVARTSDGFAGTDGTDSVGCA